VSNDGTITWRSLWAETEALVGDRAVARWICETASGCDGDEFRDVLDHPATERMVHHLDAMVARVRAGEPVQYVLGRWAFRHLDVLVDRRVLIPRPETELLVEHAIAAMSRRPRPLRIVDLGTGSGVIGLSLATELWHDGIEVWLTDASADALDVTRANCAGVGRAAASVRIAEGEWFDPLPDELAGGFDLVISNPPYIDATDSAVEPIVRDYEPAVALFAPDDGLCHIRTIIAGTQRWLAQGGTLLLEIGSSQGVEVANMLRAAGYADVQIKPDLAGHPRIAQAKKPAG
jgi:release factor glutamine methyltransferase